MRWYSQDGPKVVRISSEAEDLDLDAARFRDSVRDLALTLYHLTSIAALEQELATIALRHGLTSTVREEVWGGESPAPTVHVTLRNGRPRAALPDEVGGTELSESTRNRLRSMSNPVERD